VDLVRTDVSEEHSASIIRVTRISELGTTLAVTSNNFLLCALQFGAANVVSTLLILFTLTMETIRSSEMSVCTRAARSRIPQQYLARLSLNTSVPPSNFHSINIILINYSVINAA
jgi:hypothetical protein